MHMKLKQIGIIHTPYKGLNEVPYQSSLSEEVCELEVFDEYAEGLTDIEGFSHLIVLYWLHRSTGYSLLVRTPWDTALHGLFTTRSPNRPNPIGITIVTVHERAGTILRVSGIDAVDGTPLIDIKPYVPEFDEKEKREVKIGWLAGRIERGARRWT